MVFLFLTVYSLTSIPLSEEISFEWAILNVSVDSCVAVSLVADNLEEGRAATAWLSKHQDHLAWLYDTLEIFKDVELLALFSEPKNVGGGFEYIKEGYECVGECLGDMLVILSA